MDGAVSRIMFKMPVMDFMWESGGLSSDCGIAKYTTLRSETWH
jgi:hypothetical protein